jgi:ligand-binding SRPBCC domain-containing protein
MREHHFEAELWLPAPRAAVCAFFADAGNLDSITPPWLNFRTVTPPPIVMAAGTLIDYKLRVRGFPMRWRTKITAWQPPSRFVDEQLRGPYRLWVHEHTFEDRNGGTLARDKVRYAVPFDFVAHRLLVRPDVERIFAYRQEKLRAFFGG